MYHGLHLSLIYQNDLVVYFDLIQISLQPLDAIETMLHISETYVNYEQSTHLYFVILRSDNDTIC